MMVGGIDRAGGHLAPHVPSSAQSTGQHMCCWASLHVSSLKHPKPTLSRADSPTSPSTPPFPVPPAAMAALSPRPSLPSPEPPAPPQTPRAPRGLPMVLASSLHLLPKRRDLPDAEKELILFSAAYKAPGSLGFKPEAARSTPARPPLSSSVLTPNLDAFPPWDPWTGRLCLEDLPRVPPLGPVSRALREEPSLLSPAEPDAAHCPTPHPVCLRCGSYLSPTGSRPITPSVARCPVVPRPCRRVPPCPQGAVRCPLHASCAGRRLVRKGGPMGRMEGEGQSRDTQAGCGQVVAEACPVPWGLLLLPPRSSPPPPCGRPPPLPPPPFQSPGQRPRSFLPSLPPPVVWSLFSQPRQY